jgi:cell shape-determining protein MreC
MEAFEVILIVIFLVVIILIIVGIAVYFFFPEEFKKWWKSITDENSENSKEIKKKSKTKSSSDPNEAKIDKMEKKIPETKASEPSGQSYTVEKADSMKALNSTESLKGSQSESRIPVKRETEEFVPGQGRYISTIPDPNAETSDPMNVKHY